MTEHFVLPDVRLDRAKCAEHAAYDNNCVACTRRYYIQLIDDDYVPRYEYEDLERKKALHGCDARIRAGGTPIHAGGPLMLQRRMSQAELDSDRKYAAARERVRVVVAEALAMAFGPDNSGPLGDDPFYLGTTLDEGSLVLVQVGGARGEITLRPRHEDSPGIFYYDGGMVVRLDVPLEGGGQWDRRTRGLMHALLNVASGYLDEMESQDEARP